MKTYKDIINENDDKAKPIINFLKKELKEYDKIELNYSFLSKSIDIYFSVNIDISNDLMKLFSIIKNSPASFKSIYIDEISVNKNGVLVASIRGF